MNTFDELRKEKHRDNIRNQIISFLNEYFEQTGAQKPKNIDQYILEQVAIVIIRLYNQHYDFDDLDPRNVDPDIIETETYHDAIDEFGSVFTDYLH
jgi:hypothetical protein